MKFSATELRVIAGQIEDLEAAFADEPVIVLRNIEVYSADDSYLLGKIVHEGDGTYMFEVSA